MSGIVLRPGRAGGRPGVSRFVAGWRGLAQGTALAVVTAAVAGAGGVASASVAPHRDLRPGAHAGPGSGSTLAQAPAGLRAAVHKTLGMPGPGGAWEKAELADPGSAPGDYYGTSVAIAGSMAVVGADAVNRNTGAAYVFVRSGDTWSERAKLTAAKGAVNDLFGASVALSGSTVVIGAYGANDAAGAAYVFTDSGGTWSQQAELTDPGGAANDNFGWSVAIAGSTAVVGAPFEANTGAAYVFTGSGSAWSQQAALTDPVGTYGDQFGWSVAISGSTALVGADGTDSFTGAAYVFVGSGGTWSRQAKLTASDGAVDSNFGASVALSGSTAVVGAYGANDNTGGAYVFARFAGTWPQQAELTDPGGAANDYFGRSVAVSGSTVVVAAIGPNSFTGAAYVFVRSGGTWAQLTELTDPGGAANDYFGFSVTLSGSTLVVGADGTDSFTGAAYVFVLPSQQARLAASSRVANESAGYSVALSGSTAVVTAPGQNSSTGAVYVYVRSGSTWSQQATLTDPGGARGDQFGYSVALSGSTAVVGAPGTNSSTGAAYVFTRSGKTWSQQASLTDRGGATGDDFGWSVALSGSTAVVAAPGTNTATGAAYVFTRSGKTWSQQATLTDPGGADDDTFGSSVALSGSTAVVGAIGPDSFTGAAYVFTRSGSTWTQQATLADPGGARGDQFGYAVALSGSTALVGAPGTSESAGAAYVFTESGGTWSQQPIPTAGGDGAPGGDIGYAVALSGSTALVGAPGHDSRAGTAYVFTDSGGVWFLEAELTASHRGAQHFFGASLALTKSTALVGAPTENSATGAAYVFANM
jgi:hypothetical protein